VELAESLDVGNLGTGTAIVRGKERARGNARCGEYVGEPLCGVGRVPSQKLVTG
jgi:hypothetical protein